MKSRALLEKGLRIRIGNGYSTEIWTSPWLPDDGNFRLLTPRPQDCYFPWMVADLVNPVNGTWNVQRIETTFWPVDSARILSIPLGAITSNDRLIWHYTKNGQFSVKSAYQLSLAEKENKGMESGGASSGAQGVRWTEIWGLNLPPKVRMFLWLATKNILPLGVELTRRHIGTDPFCKHCSSDLETVSHVFMHCRGMREIWRNDPFFISPTGSHENFWNIFLKLKQSLSKDLLLVGLTMCWKAWDIRNKELHGADNGFPGDLVGWAKRGCVVSCK